LIVDRSLAIAGNTQERLDVRFAAAGRYLLAAEEHGLDALLSAAVPAGARIGLADSPIPRTGTQIILVALSAPTTLTVTVARKETAAPRGSVRILARSIGDECAALLQPMGEAHAHYARAESVTRLIDPSATADAPASYRSAVEFLRAALAQMNSSAQARLRAATTFELATALYEGAKQWPESAAVAADAVGAFAALGDDHGVAGAKALQAAALMEVARSGGTGGAQQDAAGTLARARRLLNEAIGFHARRGETYEQALAQNNVGLSFYYEGLPAQAIAAFERALALHEGLDERTRRAQVLQNMAVVRLDNGQFSEAVTDYENVLPLLREDEHPFVYAGMLNNSALANAIAGNYDVALDRYGAALEIWTRMQNPREQARSRNGLGYVYYLVGDYELAFDFYEQALAQRTAAGDGFGRASTLRTLGNLHRMLGRPEAALAMHREALTLAVTPIARNTALIQIARDFAAQSNHARAISLLDTVLNGDGKTDLLTAAYAKLDRGRSWIAQGQAHIAELDLAEALQIFRQHNLAAEQIECLIDLANVARERAAGAAAIRWLDQAIDLSDKLRAQTSNPELKATLTQPARAAVDLKVEVARQLVTPNSADGGNGQDRRYALESLAATERARARVLAEIGASRTQASDAAATVRRESLYRALSERRYEFQRVASRYGNSDARSAAVQNELMRTQAELDRLNRLSAAPDSGAREKDIAELQKELPDDACIVAYWLTGANAYAWTLTGSAGNWRRLGDAAQIDAAAKQLHAAFAGFRSVPVSERTQLAAKLHDLLIRPLDADCLRRQSLYFVPDGSLHYVPFAALLDARRAPAAYLVETHDIAILPALSSIRTAPRLARPKSLLLVSDPVFDSADPRVTSRASPLVAEAIPAPRPVDARILRGASTRARLVGTAAEAAGIASLWGKDSVTHLTGFAATRTAILAAEMDSYTHVHIATHGLFDAAAPRLSSILLSQVGPAGQAIEGRVWAGDFAALRFDAELVVLSGCETALGRYVHGEGLMGLQYLVLGRGAKSVIASTWSVPDRDAALLMSALYRRLLAHRESPARALAESMREVLRRDRSVDPAYWAAFGAMTSSVETDLD
jgi:CHAT domain-containing protein